VRCRNGTRGYWYGRRARAAAESSDAAVVVVLLLAIRVDDNLVRLPGHQGVVLGLAATSPYSGGDYAVRGWIGREPSGWDIVLHGSRYTGLDWRESVAPRPPDPEGIKI